MADSPTLRTSFNTTTTTMLKEAASTLLKERSRCPYFRILIIGRANAGKTTILEKVCGVAPGSARITYDQDGVEIGVKPGRPRLLARVRQRLRGRSKVAPSAPQVTSSMERGAHDIEHQIAYPGSNFIFHDSPGFESGANEEINNVWKFIDKRSNANELSEQLHAIWYCIPMDSPRPLLDAELQFFMKGTGKVPLVTIFTKFDAQIIQEYTKLADVEAHKDKWEQARENAENFYQEAYVSKVHETKYPPKGYVVLEDMDLPETNCPELSEKTADAINDFILHQLFVSTQMNNPDLCVKSALWDVLAKDQLSWHEVTLIIIGNFPHFWVQRETQDVYDTPSWIGEFGEQFIHQILLLFGEKADEFSVTPAGCQILTAIIIVAKQPSVTKKPVRKSLTEALEQFKGKKHVEKLKAQITSDSLPAHSRESGELFSFLYKQVINI